MNPPESPPESLSRESAFLEFASITAEGVVVLDLERRILFVNGVAARLLGVSDTGRVGAAFVYPFEEGAREELELHGGGAKPVSVELEARPLTWDGAPATLLVLRDLAPRRAALHLGQQMERQLRSTHRRETIGGLATGLAHDFNNFLTVILGRSELLLKALRGNDDLTRQVELIHMGAKQQSLLTRQFLGVLTRDERGAVDVDVAQALHDVSPVLSAALGDAIEVDLSIEPELGAARLPRGQLEQVLFNLVLNARDAMPTGGRLRIRAEVLDVDGDTAEETHPVDLASGHYVCIRVTDTGVGMSEHVRSHALDAFFTTKGASQAGGLGLAVVRGIVEDQAGAVWIESSQRHGTTITFVIPGRRRLLTALAGDDEPVAEASPEDTGGCILVAEDEPDVREMVRSILEHGDYETLEAADGHAAVEVARAYRKPLRLLLTDVVMPGLGGADVLAELRSDAPELPVLFMSGYSAQEIHKRGLIPRDAPYIQKPFAPAELLAAVALAVRNASG